MGLSYSRSVRVGGVRWTNCDHSLCIRRTTNLLIGEMTAERVKKEVGFCNYARRTMKALRSRFKGRGPDDGVPREKFRVSEAMMQKAFSRTGVEQIV